MRCPYPSSKLRQIADTFFLKNFNLFETSYFFFLFKKKAEKKILRRLCVAEGENLLFLLR